LSAEAQALLSYLGLDLAAMGAMQVSIFRLANGRDCAEAPLPFRGAGLSRFCLDQALLEAAESQGANVERGVQVTQIDASDETVTVKAGSQVFTGRAAALATGKHNLRQYARAMSDMVGFKLQFRVTPDSLGRLEDVVQLVTFNGGYIGACMVEDRLVTLCWVLHRALLQRIGTSWPEQAKYFVQQSEILAALLHEAKPQWDKPVAVAGIPYGYLRRSPIATNVFPLGDQLAVIPSFTGDGMSIALYSGIAAAQAVLAGRSATQFQAQIVGRLRPQFRWAGLVNVLFEVRRLHGFSVKLAAALPSLVTWLAQSTRLRGFERSLDRPRKARQL
jgi:flavin-dependent dehydrogenase